MIKIGTPQSVMNAATKMVWEWPPHRKDNGVNTNPTAPVLDDGVNTTHHRSKGLYFEARKVSFTNIPSATMTRDSGMVHFKLEC